MQATLAITYETTHKQLHRHYSSFLNFIDQQRSQYTRNIFTFSSLDKHKKIFLINTWHITIRQAGQKHSSPGWRVHLTRLHCINSHTDLCLPVSSFSPHIHTSHRLPKPLTLTAHRQKHIISQIQQLWLDSVSVVFFLWSVSFLEWQSLGTMMMTQFFHLTNRN